MRCLLSCRSICCVCMHLSRCGQCKTHHSCELRTRGFCWNWWDRHQWSWSLRFQVSAHWHWKQICLFWSCEDSGWSSSGTVPCLRMGIWWALIWSVFWKRFWKPSGVMLGYVWELGRSVIFCQCLMTATKTEVLLPATRRRCCYCRMSQLLSRLVEIRVKGLWFWVLTLLVRILQPLDSTLPSWSIIYISYIFWIW